MSCFFRASRAIVFLSFAAAVSSSYAAITNPLAHPSLGDFTVGLGNAVVFDTDNAQVRVNGIVAFAGVVSDQAGQANAASGIPSLAVFSFDQINIGSGVPITVVGSRGLSLLSRGDVILRGVLSVNGGDLGAVGGGGGFGGGSGLAVPGFGPGAGHPTTIGNYAGAGGGGFGGAGGRGGAYSPTDAPGGSPYGGSLRDALYAGSGGGSGINGGTIGQGGGGGGAIEISALGSVQLYSGISSNGGAAGVGANGYGGGGGGSGGSIRVAGRSIQLLGGSISASGSDGGQAFGGGGFNAGGGGGGGRILVQQSAGPLANGLAVNGGAVIGSEAQPGEAGIVEQFAASLSVTPAVLNVRLGTGAVNGVASLARTGDANSDVYGLIDHVGERFAGASPGATFAFAGVLGGGLVQTFPLTYSTTSRTTDLITVKSNGGDATLAVGRGVGPVFQTNMGAHPNTTINLGSADVGHAAAFHLILRNASTDLGIDSPLTALSILDIAITGPDASAFSFDPLIPTTLYEQQFANLPIHFLAADDRSYLATLTIVTDQGAALGSSGSIFTYTLRGSGRGITPEPASLAILGGAMVWLRRKR